METQFSRTELLIGSDRLQKLKSSNVAVFGVGGVGSFTIEALARAGVGNFTICDSDKVTISNLNRQLIALNSTIGKQKVDVINERIMDINSSAKVVTKNIFFNSDTVKEFDFTKFDYIVDAIDTVTSKLLLIEKANEQNIPIISCMGAGNKLNAMGFEVADIFKTSVCPLAKVMRLELKKRNIKSLKVVYSKEQPIKINQTVKIDNNTFLDNIKVVKKRQTTGSISFVPSVAGLILASEVVKDLIQ